MNDKVKVNNLVLTRDIDGIEVEVTECFVLEVKSTYSVINVTCEQDVIDLLNNIYAGNAGRKVFQVIKDTEKSRKVKSYKVESVDSSKKFKFGDRLGMGD